jgi:hypothetical protein
MFSFLSACPVSKLTFAVIDPENRGTSVAPYYDAKKKLQDLFDEGFSITRDEISQRINSLTQYVEYVLQEKLGTEFENIYSYADANESYEIEPKLLVVYDFPKGFDEQSLSGLKNIIKNGSRCGVYTIIIPAHQEDTGRIQNDIAKGLKIIEGLTSIIQCTEHSYVLRGMPLLFIPMPDKNEFIQFFGKYMLLFEGIKNRGIVFSPQIKKLVDAKNEDELAEQIQKKTGREVRVTVPGHMQRGGAPDPYDRVFASRLGAEAGQLILQKKFGYMVAYKHREIVKIPLQEVAGRLKYVPVDSGIIREARMLGISFGD